MTKKGIDHLLGAVKCLFCEREKQLLPIHWT